MEKGGQRMRHGIQAASLPCVEVWKGKEACLLLMNGYG